MFDYEIGVKQRDGYNLNWTHWCNLFNPMFILCLIFISQKRRYGCIELIRQPAAVSEVRLATDFIQLEMDGAIFILVIIQRACILAENHPNEQHARPTLN